MLKPEQYQSLANYYDDFTRLSVCINSPQAEYVVNIHSLRELARFLGFAEIKILSNSFSPPELRDIEQISSIVTDLETENLPPKARWRKIEILLDVNKISETLNPGFTEQERADRIEKLLKEELGRKGANNFKELSFTALFVGDAFVYACSLLITMLIMEYNNLAKPSNNEYLFMVGVLLKEFLSAIDSVVHYRQTRFGARFTALEATQYLNLIIMKSKLEATQIISLKPKGSRI